MAGALWLLALFLQGCEGGGSGAGGGDAGQSMEVAPGGAEIDAVQETQTGAQIVERPWSAWTGCSSRRRSSASGRTTCAGARHRREISARFGGEVLSAQVYGGSPVPADVVISVPLGAFDAALAELRGSGRRITTDSVRGEDVTEEFVAREPHERNLLSVEESPLKLYERAESVNDTLEIEQELTEVWGQIEQVQGRIRYPERRTASSDIILHLEPVATATPEPPWDPYLVAARDASLLGPQAACDHGDDLRRRLLLAARPGAFGGPRWLAVKPRTGPHRGPRLIPNIVDHRLVLGHASVRNGPRPARFRVRVKLFRTRPG